MAKSNFNGITIALIIFVVGSLGAGSYYYIKAKEMENEPAQILIKDYNELEKAYNKAVTDLEATAGGNYDNINILKENLKTILKEIKIKKEEIDRNRKLSDTNIEYDSTQFLLYREKLEISKQMADQILVQRLEEVEKKNKDLEEKNDVLMQQNLNLESNISKMKNFYEQEKVKNENLNATYKFINEKFQKLEDEGKTATSELTTIRKKKEEFEKQLTLSNKKLEDQNKKINAYVKSLRKVNLNCYFIYDDKTIGQTLIYLTENGVSKQYMNYYIKNKPKIHFIFEMDESLFKDDEVDKVELSVYNGEDVEIFTTSKVISTGEIHVEVPTTNIKPGKYYARLRCGDEDILINDEYVFKI